MSDTQTALHEFMDDPENIRKAAEGSMDKRNAVIEQAELRDIMDEYAEASKGYDTSDGKPMFTERMNDAVAKAHSYVTQARIDELKSLWNTTQPDIAPEGTQPYDMSEELHRRIAGLQDRITEYKGVVIS